MSFAANDASSSNQSAKDQFAAGDYTITAEVLDPTDVSSDSTVNAFRAASAADYKFYVSEDAATSSSYSAVHVVVEGAKSLNSYSDAYAAKINKVKGNIEKIREEREKARAQELTVDTPASLMRPSARRICSLGLSRTTSIAWPRAARNASRLRPT